MRKLISLLLVFILIFSFAGCGANKEPEKDNQLTESAEKIENTDKENIKTEKQQLKDLKEFPIKLNGKDVSFPSVYSDFKKSFECKELAVFPEDIENGFEVNFGRPMSVSFGEFFSRRLYLKNLTGENELYYFKLSVTGIEVDLSEDIELCIDISKTDTFASIKEKFGTPDYENEEKLILHYSLPNIKIADDIFGITFFFNDNGNGIRNIQLGYFGNLYKQ